MRPSEIIIDSIQLTEKGARLSEQDNKYMFKVDRGARKDEIKAAVEDLFDVTVTKVNTYRRKGKRKRDRRHRMGQQASWKRAVVTLKQGDTIDLTA